MRIGRLLAYLALSAIGVWLSYRLLQDRAENGLTTDPIVVLLMLVGGAVVPTAAMYFVRDDVDEVGGAWASFWSLPRVARYLVPPAVGVAAVFAWDVVLLLISDRIA